MAEENPAKFEKARRINRWIPCQGRTRFGERCKDFATPTEMYCEACRRRMSRDKNFYSQFVGPTLQEALEKVAALNAQRMSLVEEIDLARGLLVKNLEFIKMLEDSEVTEGSGSSKALSADTRHKMYGVIRNNVQFVAQLISSQAKITALMQVNFTPGQLQWLIEQLTDLLKTEVKDEAVIKSVMDKFALIRIPDQPGANPRVSITID